MSDFLLIVPEGWTQLDWQFITNNVPSMGYQDVMNGLPSVIEETLKTHGIIPVESSLIEYKLIDDTFFLVKLW